MTRGVRSKLLLTTVLVVALLATGVVPAFACTSIPVGKGASVDGSVLTTHTDDCGYCDPRVFLIPPADHKEGAMRPVYSTPSFRSPDDPYFEPLVLQGEIPQVKHTYGYFFGSYGMMNEKQVALGETTIGNRKGLNTPTGMFDVVELSKIALERSATAREAIAVMGALAEEYGYRDSGECLTVADPNEVWLFEIMGSTPLHDSAVWAAQRVPDDHISVSANRSRIGEIDLSNPDYFMASKNIFSVAEEMEWWSPTSGKPFVFYEIYAPKANVYNSRREWRVLSLVAPSLDLDPWSARFPFSVKPDKKVSVDFINSIQRDHYEGTEFDLTKGLAAGPFGTPDRWATPGSQGGAWERAISIFRAAYTWTAQLRNWLPDEVGGVLWFGSDTAHATVYVPFYAGIAKLPEAYTIGTTMKFNKDAAWWVFDFVENFANLKYSYMIKDIQAKQKELEGREFAMQPAIDMAAADLWKQSPALAREFLTQYCVSNGTSVVKAYWDFAESLIVKYNDGYLNDPKVGSSVGYPAEWLKGVGFGPLPVPTK
ncbi:MAG: C69 family dipeptidase [Clostridia bacterium]|nr:C69 family dipeptidase [Clostridia bacterium]